MMEHLKLVEDTEKVIAPKDEDLEQKLDPVDIELVRDIRISSKYGRISKIAGAAVLTISALSLFSYYTIKAHFCAEVRCDREYYEEKLQNAKDRCSQGNVWSCVKQEMYESCGRSKRGCT